MTDTIDLLSTRRSVPGPNLLAPGPDAAALEQILTIGTRVPDHGKLEPWRIVLIENEAVSALGRRIGAMLRAREPDIAPERLRKEESRFCAPLVVAVISRAGDHPKIPEWEQVLSAGAVCMNIETAAVALGFGAQWITGWPAYDEEVRALLGVLPEEKIAGFIQIGTPDLKPTDRPRPDLARIVSRWSDPA
jgi:nitroreductase